MLDVYRTSAQSIYEMGCGPYASNRVDVIRLHVVVPNTDRHVTNMLLVHNI